MYLDHRSVSFHKLHTQHGSKFKVAKQLAGIKTFSTKTTTQQVDATITYHESLTDDLLNWINHSQDLY